jgi:glutathione S-transferase
MARLLHRWQNAPMQTARSITLTGYRHSNYTRIARMVLHEKGVAFSEIEVNPFSPPLPAGYPHPFGRVPVLTHGGFTLFETSAIARYIDLAFPGPALVPGTAQAAARMAQVIAIADAYAFRPLVLQVYAHRVFRPLNGLAADEAQIAEGFAAAPRALAALDAISTKGAVLTGTSLTLADCHLAPMLAAYLTANEGRISFVHFPALSAWWDEVRRHPSFIASGRDPPVPGKTS